MGSNLLYTTENKYSTIKIDATHYTGYMSSNYSFYYYFGRPCHVACGILVPQPGIEPMPPAVEAYSLNRWTVREVPTPRDGRN